MKTILSTSQLLKSSQDTVVLFSFEDKPASKLYSKQLSKDILKLVNNAIQTADFKGNESQMQLLYTNTIPKRIILLGLGKSDKLLLYKVREAVGVVIRSLDDTKISELSIPSYYINLDEKQVLSAIAESAIIAGHHFTMSSKPKNTVSSLIIPVSKKSTDYSKALHTSITVAQAQNNARDLSNLPGSIATPEYFANYAKKLCNGKLKCTVYDKKAIQKLNMNALLAVNSGSIHEPRFVVVEYNGSPKSQKIVLVGKGITFDSGGLSLKFPAVYMETMKHDRSGAAIVLFTILAAAKLNLKVNIVALMPLTENMPGNNAYKPGDIIRTMSGKTVEVLNTDAEGRLVLCDALHFAKRYNPKFMVDIATLTGSCYISLGANVAGIMGNDQELIDLLRTSGKVLDERLWQLPMHDDYGKMIKSNFADLKNVVANTLEGGGTITAAKFLENFVDNRKWAHIDIGGTGWVDRPSGYKRHGATAFGLRMFVDFLSKQQ